MHPLTLHFSDPALESAFESEYRLGAIGYHRMLAGAVRSEERRVGKECRL